MTKGRNVGLIFVFILMSTLIFGNITVSMFATMSGNSLPPSLSLLGAAAKWAAGNGSRALHVSMFDNLVAHPLPIIPDPNKFLLRSVSISHALRQYGLNEMIAADIPSDLSEYDVIVIDANFACEPSNEPIIRNYLSSGGGVVLRGSAPCYLSTYSKSFSAGNDLTPIQEWFGASHFVNPPAGRSHVTIDHPFDTELITGDTLYLCNGSSSSGITSLHDDIQDIAEWDTGENFAFTHIWNTGRVYYQADVDILPLFPTQVVFEPNILNLESKRPLFVAYIESLGNYMYGVSDINVSTIMLNDTIAAEPYPVDFGDFDNDTIPDLMIAFNTSSVAELIISKSVMYGDVTLALAGQLYNGVLVEVYGVIKVRMPADENFDGKVDLRDIYIAAKAFGSFPSHPRWNQVVDENEDNTIDLRDYYIICRNYGKTYM